MTTQNEILFDREGAVAWIRINRPQRLNAFSPTMREELEAALIKSESDPDVRCIVLTGVGRAFCTGGDVKVMHELIEQGDSARFEAMVRTGARVVQRIAEMKIPVIAAVNGPAAGAGACLALACDLRVASEAATIGFGFLRVGLHPDWGGSYFLPRLIGHALASEFLLTGEMISAERGERMNLFNRVVPAKELEATARTLAGQIASGPASLVAEVKRTLRESLSASLPEILELETEAQMRAFSSPDFREGIDSFLETRTALLQEKQRPTQTGARTHTMTRPIQRVCVIGAGTMGHGIAQVSAMAGLDVVLLDASAELAERGRQRIRENLDEGVRREKVTAQTRDEAMSRITASGNADAAADADLVIEAVPEKMELKQTLFRELGRHVHDKAVLASNTSSLSITELQRATAHADRFVGLHFFNPVHINRLVEVIVGKDTSPETLATALDYVRRIDKEPVVVNDSPGFATSRLGVLLGLEAMRMLEEGVASAADIDKALELGYRHPMGPLRLTDLVGLDVRLDIARYLHEKLGAEHFRPPAILERMVAEGKLGKKTGEGFYKWS